MISFKRFREIELRVGEITKAEPVKGSAKLLLLLVSLKEQERQIIAGIARQYSPEELLGRQIVIAVNLEQKEIMGEVSEGMLLAADTEAGPVLLVPEKPVEPGAKVG